MMFASGHLTSLLTLGVNTGLVMDVGYTETLVVPVSLFLCLVHLNFTAQSTSSTDKQRICVNAQLK